MSKNTDLKSQRDRFIEAARQLGADEDESAFKAELATVAKQKPKVSPIAKAHSAKHAQAFVALGWTVSKEFKCPGNAEPYEYLLVWNGFGDPQSPSDNPADWG